MDDLPVGASQPKAGSMQEEFATSQNQVDSSGPLEERLQSKNWSTRAAAYDELNLLFKGASNPKDQIFSDYSSNWKKYLTDSNPGALEKCLDSLQTFIDLGDPKLTVSFQNDIIRVLIEKCIGHMKPTIKQKGLECFNLLFEVTESFDDSIETMIECLNAKNIKSGQSALIALNSWVSNYGNKKIKLKSFFKIIETYASSPTPALRSEAINFYKEVYKWLGDVIKSLYGDLKKQQQDELDKAFEELKDKPANRRFTRAEKKKMKDSQVDELIAMEEQKCSAKDSAYDLADAVDIMKNYGNEWQDKILEMKKWNEKKELLEKLISDTTTPKLKEDDYTGLIKTLKKLIGDSNPVVSQMAVKAIGCLAKGLRKDFGDQNVRDLAGTLIQKFKEKKTQTIEEVHGVLDQFIECSDLEILASDIVLGINDKAPTVRKNVCTFLQKLLLVTYIDVIQKNSDEIIDSLKKSSEDGAGDIRDAALTTLGIFKGRLGECNMSKHLQDLNPQKMVKVNESASTVVPSKYDKPEKKEPKKIAPPPKGKKVIEEKKKEEKKVEIKEEVKEEKKEMMKKKEVKKQEVVQEQEIYMEIDGEAAGQPYYDPSDMPLPVKKQVFDEFGEMPLKSSGYNLDNLEELEAAFGGQKKMGDDVKPIKKAPPKLSSQNKKLTKEEEKNDNSDDFNQTQDEPKVLPKKPAPKPKETAVPKQKEEKKGDKGKVTVQEEDLGSGLSKEEAEAKVIETFSAEHIAAIEEGKWQSKVEGFKGIGQEFIQLQPGADVIEAISKYVKEKMKGWKESNFNLVKETIALFMVIVQNSQKINKRAVSCAMPFFSEKIGDVKVQQSVHELLMLLAEVVTPKFIGLQILKHAGNAKSPNIHKESCIILANLTEDFGIGSMPLQEMIAYGSNCLGDKNPQVRTASMALFSVMYKHMGESIKNFLKDINASTMKLMEEEFNKVTVLKKGEHKSKRQLAGDAALEAGAGGDGLDDLLPRADISKSLNAKLWPMFKNTEWKIRKEAAEKVEAILKEANMRIQPVGLKELIDNLKQRMADPNKSVLKIFIQLLTQIVEALGSHSKNYSKILLPPLLANLADKQGLLRNDVVTCADKWGEHIGADKVINYMAPLLMTENPELRTEVFTWILKNKDSIKTIEVKEIIKPLVSCLSDKSGAIRGMAEQTIQEVMPLTGFGAFKSVSDDLPVAIQNSLKPVLEKIKVKVGAQNTGSAPSTEMNGSLGQTKGNSNNASLKAVVKNKEESKNSSLRDGLQKGNSTATNKQIPPVGNMSNTAKADIGQNKNTFGEALKNKQASAQKTTQRSESKEPQRQLQSKGGLGASMISQSEMSQSQIADSLNIVVGQKEKRGEIDKRSKWQLEEIKGEQIEKLKQQIVQVFGQEQTKKMFSDDFKQHAEIIEILISMISNSGDQIKEIIDLVFKWIYVKLADQKSFNTQFAVKAFDFYSILFTKLEEDEYQLLDFEAAVIFPFLCEKTGLNMAILKEKVKKLIKMVYGIYDKSKCYNALITYGLNSKNMKAQAECLDELELFIQNYGIGYTQEKDLRLIAKMADCSDKSVRDNSIKVLAEAYKYTEEDIWRLLGDITPKVKGFLEQRFKKSKGGMTQSGSQSNLFQPESSLGQQSPRASKQDPSKTSFGFQKQKSTVSNVLENSKKSSMTPRSGIPLSKDQERPPTANKNLQQSNLSKSINQFNQSNKSNGEEQKQLMPKVQPQLVNQPQSQGQQQQLLSSKHGMLKKVMSQEPQETMGLQKKVIPQTTRMESSQGFEMGQKKLQGAGKAKADAQDEDEDLRILIDNLHNDEMMDKQSEEINKHILQLKHGDLSKRVDSLVALNEMISSIETNKYALMRTANALINAFTHVLNDIFERHVDEIPLRFAKYFITIVLKACSCKEIMKEASEESIFELAEQLLTRLLIENLDKVGENKEGELILKNLNSSMIRLLENCNHTYIFCVLFNLLRKYKDFHKMSKLPGLIIKCLLKLSKILEKLIEKLDMEKILLSIHEYLVAINHEQKTQNDEMGIRIVKTVTNELVKLKRESIWEAYNVIQCHNQQDHYIFKWISIILKSLAPQGNSGQENLLMASIGSKQQLDGDIKSIIDELKNSEQFENAIPKLYNFLISNPQIDLNENLQECSKTFADFIKKNLDKYKALMKEEQKSNDDVMMQSTNSNSDHSRGNQNQEPNEQRSGSMSTSNRMMDYQSKLAKMKQQNNHNNPAIQQKEQIQQQEPQKQVLQPNLNTSFSDMNNRLTQKWNKLNANKQGGNNDGSSTQSHMSSTMGGFGKVGTLERANMNLNQSSGGTQMDGEQPQRQGATNSDFNARLAEMKAKLQALKKK